MALSEIQSPALKPGPGGFFVCALSTHREPFFVTSANRYAIHTVMHIVTRRGELGGYDPVETGMGCRI